MIVSRLTVRPLNRDEKKNLIKIKNCEEYNEMIRTNFGEYNPRGLEPFENDNMQELMFQLEEDTIDCVLINKNSDVDMTRTKGKFSTVTKTDANEENTVRETSEKKRLW